MAYPKVPARSLPVQFQLDLGDAAGASPYAPESPPPALTAPAETPHQIVARVFRALRPRTPLPANEIQWRKYANVHSSIRLEQGALLLKISDLLESSPATVLEALAYILLGKLYRKPIAKAYTHRYNLYLNRRDVRRDMSLVRETRGRKFISGPQGQVYDLALIFEELNRRYFEGLMACPQLGWSRTPSRSLLGHFDPCQNAIIISRIFDNVRIPRLALEFVMYHEMLHLRFPTEYRGARRCIHTPEFKLCERDFTGWKEAGELLKRL
jgi:hypothetical protein